MNAPELSPVNALEPIPMLLAPVATVAIAPLPIARLLETAPPPRPNRAPPWYASPPVYSAPPIPAPPLITWNAPVIVELAAVAFVIVSIPVVFTPARLETPITVALLPTHRSLVMPTPPVVYNAPLLVLVAFAELLI